MHMTIRNNVVKNEILRVFTINLPRNSRDFRIYIVDVKIF